jgi:hypothetical protein
LREHNDIGVLLGDHCCLEREGSSLPVYPAVIGEAEQHADQEFKAIRIELLRTLGPFDLDEHLRFVRIAAVPPVMRDTCLNGGGLSGSERQRPARDAGIEPTPEDCELLD